MKQKLLFVAIVGIGILIGSGINYITSDLFERVLNYTSVIDNIRFKTDAQQPVIKAMQVKSYVEYQNNVYLKMEFIKLRDCGVPIVFAMAHSDRGQVAYIHNVEFFDDNGVLQTKPKLVGVDPLKWQTTYWIKLPLSVRDHQFYINTSYACPTLFLGEDRKEAYKQQADPAFSNAIDIVTSSYGPFNLRDEKFFAGIVDKLPQ